jgi:hypothetical protein
MERPVMNTSLVIGTFQVYDDNSDVELSYSVKVDRLLTNFQRNILCHELKNCQTQPDVVGYLELVC